MVTRMSESAITGNRALADALTSQPKKPFKSPPPPKPSRAQTAKDELIKKPKSKPSPPEPPGIGERFTGPLGVELSSGPPPMVNVVMPPPPGVCAVPCQAIHPTPHPEVSQREPLILLMSEDSLKFEDLRKEITAMTMSVGAASSSEDWMKAKEDIDELINAEVAVGFLAVSSSEMKAEEQVNFDAPPFDTSSARPVSAGSPSLTDYTLNAFNGTVSSLRSVEDEEPGTNVNTEQEVKVETGTVVSERFAL